LARALDGIRVLDLGQIYNGSYCGLLLSYMGAEVIKIEPPHGENLRKRTSGEQTDSFAFAMLNSNKRGVTLNLKSEKGKELFLELVKDADVVIENYAVGVMDRLGIGYDQLKMVNPKLIFASGKGYGSEGPYKDFLAMDLTIQAMSGVMSVTGYADGPPMKSGPAIADFMGGIHLVTGVLGALYSRERTGYGQKVEVSMHDAVLPTLTSPLEAYYRTNGTAPERTGNRHGGLSTAPYNVYESNDGHIAIICVNNNHWKSLCRVMNREELIDSRFNTNMKRVANIDYIDEQINLWTKTMGKGEIHAILTEAHVPCAPILTLKEVVSDPHYMERGMIKEVDHPQKGKIHVFGTPIQLSDSEPIEPVAAPLLGQHNEEVYKELLGITPEQFELLKQEKIV
jgi:crotonobetainyl-CoA:carnitine CoA-transferase CaiB-like acyl-CoA transferase